MLKSSRNVKLLLALFVVAIAVISAVISSLQGSDEIPEGKMYVDFIDVGQGDCTLITTDDSTILVDGGESGMADTVINYLKTKGVTKIDCCIATHPHSDHIGSLSEVFNEFEIDTVIMPEIPEDILPTSRTYEKFLDSLDDNAKNVVPAVAGETHRFGEIKIEILGPVDEYDDLNLMSVVAKISYGDTSVMFTGDAEEQAEKDMLENNSFGYSADILKAGHHGSNTSTCDQWLYAVDPDFVVISCAIDNSYGHPHKEVISKLEDNNIEYYRTDLVGDICFESDGKKFVLINK